MPHKDPEARKRYAREHYRRNATHINQRAREYRQRYEKQNRLRRNLEKLSRKSGVRVTVYQYEEMRTGQSGKCAICGRPEATFKRRLSVDHDHESGAIRGLLCGPCNQAIGLFQESPSALRAAALYLERSWDEAWRMLDDVYAVTPPSPVAPRPPSAVQ